MKVGFLRQWAMARAVVRKDLNNELIAGYENGIGCERGIVIRDAYDFVIKTQRLLLSGNLAILFFILAVGAHRPEKPQVFFVLFVVFLISLAAFSCILFGSRLRSPLLSRLFEDLDRLAVLLTYGNLPYFIVKTKKLMPKDLRTCIADCLSEIGKGANKLQEMADDTKSTAYVSEALEAKRNFVDAYRMSELFGQVAGGFGQFFPKPKENVVSKEEKTQVRR